MKYVLAKDLPFAKIGDGHTLELNDKSCDIIDKDGFRHPLSFGHEFFKNGVKRLLEEGWIKEVKPREWYEVEIQINGEWIDAGSRYKSEQLAREAACRFSANARFIKVCEVIDD